MLQAGVTRLVVVTGFEHERIIEALASSPDSSAIAVVRNPQPERGQLSSLWVGMDEVCDADTEALVMTPVDVPTIAPSTIAAVVDAWRSSPARIVRPVVGARKGHPVLFDREIFDELRRTPLDQGARAVLRSHAHELLDLPVQDIGCIADVDTPEDYDAMRRSQT